MDMNEAQSKHDEETYKELGRFVVAFSHLLHSLESSTIFLFELGPYQHAIRIQAALADRTAAPIAASFFSVFFKRWEGALSKDEESIMACVRKEIDEIIKERNRLMHDVWLSKSVGGDPGPHDLSRLRVRAHGKGVEYESKDYSPASIREMVAKVERLVSVVNASTWYRREGQLGPELTNRLRIVNGRVVREPTKA